MDIYSRSLAYKNSRKERIKKIAASLLTPEAEQAAMMGAAPGGAPMDPAMMGAAPGAAPMDPAMMGAAPGGAPANTQVPPEILSDMEFVQFLQMTAGIVFDPNVMSFMGPDGSPIPANMILQAYDAFNQQRAMSQGAAPGAAPMDPAMMGAAPMDPAMMGAAPGAAPMDPAMGGIDLASLEKTISALDKRISSMMNKLDSMKDMIESSINTKDTRNTEDANAVNNMRSELEKELAINADNSNNDTSKYQDTKTSLYNILAGSAN